MTKSEHNRAKPHIHTATACLHNRTVAIYIVRYPSWLHFLPNLMLKSAANSLNTSNIYQSQQLQSIWRKRYHTTMWAQERQGKLYDVIPHKKHHGIVLTVSNYPQSSISSTEKCSRDFGQNSQLPFDHGRKRIFGSFFVWRCLGCVSLRW